MKLTRRDARAHQEALALLQKSDVLSLDETIRVFGAYHPGATNITTLSGAYFTPPGLARALAEIVPQGARVLDLCAGIGALSWALRNRNHDIVCVEKNGEYVAAGRRLVPWAKWIEADVFSLPADLGRFDCVISNPPFGRCPRTGDGPRYKGANFEFHVIDIAQECATLGVFVLPSGSAPTHMREDAAPLAKFCRETGLRLHRSDVDTAPYRSEWRDVAPSVEVVTVDFQRKEAAAA